MLARWHYPNWKTGGIPWLVMGLVTTAEYIGFLSQSTAGQDGLQPGWAWSESWSKEFTVHLCLWGCGLDEGRSQVKSCMGEPGTPPGGWSVQTGSITALASWVQAENDGDGWVLSLRSWGELTSMGQRGGGAHLGEKSELNWGYMEFEVWWDPR